MHETRKVEQQVGTSRSQDTSKKDINYNELGYIESNSVHLTLL